MVQLRPPVCDKTDNYEFCLLVVRDVFELRNQLIFAKRQKERIDRKIQKLEGWVDNDIGIDRNNYRIPGTSSSWDTLTELVKIKKGMDSLRKGIFDTIEIKNNVLASALLDEGVGDRLRSESPGEPISDFLSFGEKTTNKKNILGKAIADSIMNSISRITRKTKLANRQYKYDIENLVNAQELSDITYNTQQDSIRDQIELFESLQRRNINNLGEEVSRNMDKWSKMLTPESLGKLIEYTNLNSEYLTLMNELESNNPTSSNLTKLVTTVSRNGNLDKFREREVSNTKDEIENLNKQKKEWSIYQNSIAKLVPNMFSEDEDTVRKTMTDMLTELPKIKPTLYYEDAKVVSARQNDIDAISELREKMKKLYEDGERTKEEYDNFMKASEASILNLTKGSSRIMKSQPPVNTEDTLIDDFFKKGTYLDKKTREIVLQEYNPKNGYQKYFIRNK